MKGVSPLLSYSTLLAVGFIAVALILFTVSDFADDIGKRFTKAQIDFVAESIKTDILKLYALRSEGKILLSVPENIGNKKYMIELNQNELKVSIGFKNEIIEVKKQVKINATLNGSSYPPASIEMKRYLDNISISLVA